MRIGIVKEKIKEIIKSGEHLPIFLWGPPGIGKSSIVRQIAEELGIGFVDLRLSLLDPSDLRGLPKFDEEEVKWLPPAFLPKNGEGILFLDEINLAPHTVQAAAYQLILDRRVGEYVLPEGWRIIAAGNRLEDRAFVYEMPAPLANRFVHFEVETNLEDWKKWAYENDICKEVIAFLNFRPELLFKFDPKSKEKAFPTPRSWEFVSKLLKMGIKDMESIAGAVGKGAAVEFVSFLAAIEEMPDVKEVLTGKDIIPERADVMHALISALIHFVKNAENGDKYIDRLVEYALKLEPQFAVLLIKDALKNGIPVSKSRHFKEFSIKYKDLII